MSYMSMHLEGLSINEGDKIQIVTSQCQNRMDILRSMFMNYDLEIFNIPGYVGHIGNSHREICENQGDYFEKFYRISK